MPAKKQEDTGSETRSFIRGFIVRSLPALIILCGVLTIAAPNLRTVLDRVVILGGDSDERRIEVTLAPFFTPEVTYWQPEVGRWANAYNLDPNLVATIIQIESCGDPQALSSAGAQGLMQVMPQHFSASQDPFDPDTNVQRGLDILTECLYSPYNPDRDLGLAFACYNGGPSVFVSAWDYWPQQSRDYYIWGTRIYADVQAGEPHSQTLDDWLLAGGESLCRNARETLGLTPDE